MHRRAVLIVTLILGALLAASCGSEGASRGDAAVMRSVGFDLQPFDPATGRAGALVITGTETPHQPNASGDAQSRLHNDRARFLFLPFGRGEAGDERDPQWNVFLPLGTPVLSLVDGTVCEVPVLYSGDYSVRVAPAGASCGSNPPLFETEHVIDPVVKPGDEVAAGQQVATVSDYQSDWKELGFGIVEIGVAFPPPDQGPPLHVCPTTMLASDVKATIVAALQSVMDAWAAEFGDPSLYDGANVPEAGCYVAEVRG